MAPHRGNKIRPPRKEVDFPTSRTYADAMDRIANPPSTTVYEASDNSALPTLTLHSRGNPTIELQQTSGRAPDQNIFHEIEKNLKKLGIFPTPAETSPQAEEPTE